MSSLEDLVEPLKREVAVPGTFASVFPSTTDDDLEAALLDAFAQSQLDGFFTASTATDTGVVTPDLSRGANALIVIYAGVRLLTAELINRKSHTRYEASGAIFEQDFAASVMVQALKDLSAKKAIFLEQIKQSLRSQIGTTVVDSYFVKATEFYRGEISYGYAEPRGRY
jgi:hypothetical protein